MTQANNTPLRTQGLRRLQAGVTLVELLVAMVLGIFLVGAVGIIYVSTSTGSRSSTLESQMNEDATLALELLQQQLRLAGYSTLDKDDDNKRRFYGLAVRGCEGGFQTNADGGTTAFGSLSCTDNDSAPDSLAIRYQATLLNSQEVDDGGVKYPDNCSHNAIRNWVAGATEGSTASIALADNRYYIANDANDSVPTLHCRGRDGSAGDGFSNATALVPNIEDMQVLFAVTRQPVDDEPLPHQVTAYLTAEEVDDLTDGWTRVAAVQVCLLARSAQPAPRGANSNDELGFYRDCAGNDQTSDDRYLRRAYVTTVQLRNVRPAVPATYDTDGSPEIRNPWAFLSESE